MKKVKLNYKDFILPLFVSVIITVMIVFTINHQVKISGKIQIKTDIGNVFYTNSYVKDGDCIKFLSIDNIVTTVCGDYTITEH